jgi:pentatricopeptide repeat protein
MQVITCSAPWCVVVRGLVMMILLVCICFISMRILNQTLIHLTSLCVPFVIDIWSKSGKIDKAMACLNKMTDEGKPPTVVTYTTLIDGFFCSGGSDEAIVLWDKMQEKGCAPNEIAYIALVNGLCKCGQVETALSYYEEMMTKSFGLDIFSLLHFITFLISHEHASKGCEILKEVLQKNMLDINNMKMVESVSKAVEELSKYATTSSDIKILVDKGYVQRRWNQMISTAGISLGCAGVNHDFPPASIFCLHVSSINFEVCLI